MSHEEKEEELILCVLGLCMLGLCMLDARFSWCIRLVHWRECFVLSCWCYACVSGCVVSCALHKGLPVSDVFLLASVALCFHFPCFSVPACSPTITTTITTTTTTAAIRAIEIVAIMLLLVVLVDDVVAVVVVQ